MANNLQVINTGLDHLYLNGVPIVELSVDISDVFKKVARISSLAVNADPYFSNHRESQKVFSESHGEGDRISRDFLEEGAKELRSMFTPFQRLIPEGSYDCRTFEEVFVGNTTDVQWDNPGKLNIEDDVYVDAVHVKVTSGSGDIQFLVNGVALGVVSLPVSNGVSEFLSYDLSGYLGGYGRISSYEHTENLRGKRADREVELWVANESSDFVFDYKITGTRYNGISWIKALSEIKDVKLPSSADNICVNYLKTSFIWRNVGSVMVTGVSLKHVSGSADVSISNGDVIGNYVALDKNTIGEDYANEIKHITSISINVRDASDDFCYHLTVNTVIPIVVPSPRFEFDSGWNKGKIIYRYQNMDTRENKLDYTSETLRDVRVDPNTFDEVEKYVSDSLKNYILKELYAAIGYDKKADEYSRKYEHSRMQAKFWLRSEKGLKTQYMYF